MPQLYSNCCHAEMHTLYTPPICPVCKEGCGVEEAYEPRVGDRVWLKGVIVQTIDDSRTWVQVDTGNGCKHTFDIFDGSVLELLSRKTRTLTKAEAEALLTEKLGESVRIE